MSHHAALEPLLAPVAAIQRLIDKLDGKGIIIGGVAASLLGQPRLTADADALLLLSIDEVRCMSRKRNAKVARKRKSTRSSAG